MLAYQVTEVERELPQDQKKQWFAVRTHPRCEKAVRERLARKGYEELVPFVTRTSQWSDRIKKIQEPLFPGYCFARFDSRALFDILQVRGVCYIVGCGNRPESIPDEEIEALRKLVMTEVPYCPHPNIPKGKAVQIVRGPLAGIRGRLMRYEGKDYVAVSVRLIGLSVRVKVCAKDLIAILGSVGMVEEVVHGSRNYDTWEGCQLPSVTR